MKARLMAQAAEAMRQQEEAGSGATATASSPGEARLWQLQADLLAADDLACDLEACFQPRAPVRHPPPPQNYILVLPGEPATQAVGVTQIAAYWTGCRLHAVQIPPP